MIRHATAKDVPTIVDLVRKNNFRRDSKQNNGLVEYPDMPEKWWLRRIESPHFYVGMNGSDVPVGFLSAYERDHLASPDFEDDEVVQRILSGWKGLDYAYADVLVVDPEHRREGLASELFRKLFGEVQGTRVITAVVKPKGPKKGVQHMLEGLGFRHTEWIHAYDLPFAIYER